MDPPIDIETVKPDRSRRLTLAVVRMAPPYSQSGRNSSFPKGLGDRLKMEVFQGKIVECRNLKIANSPENSNA
jgi:hypothetical protein